MRKIKWMFSVITVAAIGVSVVAIDLATAQGRGNGIRVYGRDRVEQPAPPADGEQGGQAVDGERRDRRGFPGRRGPGGPGGRGGFGGPGKPGGHDRGGFGMIGGPGFGEFLPLHNLDRIADVLGLTEEQVAQLEAIAEAAKVQRETSQEALKTAREAFRAALTAEVPSNEAVQAAANALGDAVAAAAAQAATTMLQARAVLTPEQVALIQEHREARKERMEELDGEGSGNPAGKGRGERPRRGR